MGRFTDLVFRKAKRTVQRCRELTGRPTEYGVHVCLYQAKNEAPTVVANQMFLKIRQRIRCSTIARPHQFSHHTFQSAAAGGSCPAGDVDDRRISKCLYYLQCLGCCKHRAAQDGRCDCEYWQGAGDQTGLC